MSYSIRDAADGDAAEWDDFTRGQQGWTSFHLYAWRHVIGSVFGHRTFYLMARRSDGSLAGVLPLVRVRSRLFGDFLVSMPFLNYGGPLGDAEAQVALVRHVLDMPESRGADLVELRCRDERELGLPASARKITVLTDLPREGGPDVLWKALDAKVRSQVRRPEKEGVQVRFGPEHLEDFFRVFAHHMRDLGTPVLPLRFFRSALEAFGDAMWVGVAYLGDEAVACGCGFEWGTEFEMTWASSLRRHARTAPNMLLYWSFMKRASERGLRVFNFGRCTPGSGTHKFKRQWNSYDQQLWWYQHSRSGATSTPSPDGKYSLGPRLWRHLPVSVATALGPRIVRNIP